MASAPKKDKPLTKRNAKLKAECSLSFEDPTILRGTSTSEVLRCWAEVFGERTPVEQDYARSVSVDHIDAFVSHNWSTPRLAKFFALAFHFNLTPSILITMVVSTIVSILVAVGIFPRLVIGFGSDDDRRELGFTCQLSVSATLIVTTLSWHEICKFLGISPGPKVFLDKVCVHQTDGELKRKGIEHLAAFLAHSWSLVVLYSDVYLDKLWTVYEFATFLLLFPGGQVYVQPLNIPKLVSVAQMIVHLTQVSIFVVPCARTIGTRMLLSEPAFIAMVLICRNLAKEQAAIVARMRRFSINGAACLCEADREVVLKNIAVFSVHFGIAGAGTRADALEAFNTFVNTEVPSALAACWGKAGLPYQHVCVICICMWGLALDKLAKTFMDGGQPAELGNIAMQGVWMFTGVFAIAPLSCAFCYKVANILLRLTDGINCIWDAGVTVLLATLVMLVGQSVNRLLEKLYRLSMVSHSRQCKVALIVFSLAIFLVTYTVYERPSSAHSRLRVSAACESPRPSVPLASLRADAPEKRRTGGDPATDGTLPLPARSRGRERNTRKSVCMGSIELMPLDAGGARGRAPSPRAGPRPPRVEPKRGSAEMAT